jgi:PqqD family protein of HPr-rel-A system
MNRFAQLALSEEGFVFDPMSGQSYQVNPIGILILKELRAKKDVSDIVSTLTTEFEVSTEEAEQDVSDFIERLKRYGISGGDQDE